MVEKLRIKLTFKDCLSLVYIGTIVMPILDQIVNTYLLVLLVGLLNLIFCIDVIEKLKGEKAWFFLALIVPIVLMIFEGLMEGKLGIIFIYQILRNTLLIFLGLYYTLVATKESVKSIFMITIGMLIVTAITSIIVLAEDPLAARIMATVGDSSNGYAIEMNMRNLGGFAIVYLSVGLLPFLLYMAVAQKHSKVFWVGSIILFSVYIFMSSYTTAILVGVFAILFTVFGAKANKKGYVFAIFFLLILLIFFLRYQIADLLYKLSDLTVDIVSNRFRYLADSIYGVGTDSDAQLRVDYYAKAWESFLANPLLGGYFSGSAKTSGHSFILDMLAKYGCFGIFVLYLEYKAIHRLFYRGYNKQKPYYYAILSFIVCIALALLNPSENLFLLIFFLPIGLKSLEGAEGGGNICNISM